jgi:dipeptidyl aminopeptidase/acylaminoacyl peptidase
MFVGISNKISKFGTTDIPDEEFYVHALHRPWEMLDFFAERSPITYADRCKTPLLIMGGKDDPRVDPSQSKEMYRWLKARGQAPVRLVQYPGEGHGNRKACAKLDYSVRMMQWMQHYLTGGGGAPPAMDVEYGDPLAVD